MPKAQIKDEKTYRKLRGQARARKRRPGSPMRRRQLAQQGRPQGRQERLL